MRRPLLLALSLAMALGACNRAPLTAAKAAPETATVKARLLASGPPQFVGRWATSTSTCSGSAWTVGVDHLVSPGPLSCSFSRVAPTDAGYTVDSICSVGKASSPGRLVFTLTRMGADQSLSINGGPFDEPISLVRCADSVQAAATRPGGVG